MNNLDPLMSSARTGDIDKDEWRTPRKLYNLLDREFLFDLDPAATRFNALAENFFTKEDDGLRQTWWGNVFVNPPYSQLKLWVQKGFESVIGDYANVVVMLVPARTDTAAWWDFIRFGDVRFLRGRLKFEGGKHSAPFPSAVVVFDQQYLRKRHAKTYYWDIQEMLK